MNYNAQRQRAATSNDPLIELVWMCFMAALIILGAPAIILGLIGSRQILDRVPPEHQRLVWAGIVLLMFACLYIGYRTCWPLSAPGSPFMVLFIDVAHGLHDLHQLNYSRLFHEIVPVWWRELLIAPAAIAFCAVSDNARPRSLAQILRQRTRLRVAQRRRAGKKAERALRRREIPDSVVIRRAGHPYIVLGVPVEGTLLEWIKHRLFCLPFEYLILHAVVIGASGSGKSETLLRIAIAAAKILKWQVIYIDAKGDYKFAAKFLLAMQDAGITNVRMFPRDKYDGWRGSRDAMLSRLLAIDNVAEVTSSGQHHYATVRENLIEMCINAPGGPPTNSEELLDRLMLTNGVLFDAYDGYPNQQAYLESILARPQDALSTYGHYRAFFSKLHGKLDGDWAYDDCDAAYVLLDGLGLPEITDGMARFLMADFVNYVTRKDWDKRVMFVFDEAGDLKVPLYRIFEKVRFRQTSVVVSSQDPSGLAHKRGGVGTWDEVRSVLGNSAIRIVHRSEDAHEVIRRAGTAEVADEDYRLNQEWANIGGGAHIREELKIDHNDVMHLKPGEIFVVGPGEYERVLVEMRPFDEARWRQLYKELERQSKEEPPPMPRKGRGAKIVDSTLASGASNGSTSGTQKPGSNNNGKKNGKPSGQQNGGLPSPSAKPSGQKQQGKNGSSSSAPPGQTGAQPANAKSSAPPPAQKQPGQQATPPAPGSQAPDVDETLPFALPEVDPNVPTQPGVLPLWDEKDEDLLP